MTAISLINLTSTAQLAGLDLETALMSVQSQRASLLEDQLKGQLQEVQARNAKIAKINEALSAARELSSQFSEKAGQGDKISSLVDKQANDYKKNDPWKTENKDYRTTQETDKKKKIETQDTIIKNEKNNQKAIVDKAKKEKVKNIEKTSPEWQAAQTKINAAEKAKKEAKDTKIEDLTVDDSATKAGSALAQIKSVANEAGVDLSKLANKGELLTLIENLKSSIDSQSNSQQMDMLRLQSLSNKRNEAFETMTNFIKKMQESRSSINGNMR